MNIGLVGSGSYIAGYLKAALEQNKDVSRIVPIDNVGKDSVRHLDLRKASSVNAVALDDTNCLVFMAAVSSADTCKTDFDASWNINVTGTSALIRRALDKGIRVLFFSSDAVFGNDTGTAFTEDSPTLATTSYGNMKKTVEDEFKSDGNFKSIRLSYVVSTTDKFVSYCLSCMRSGTEAEAYHPFYRNCITVDTVSAVVNWLLSHWADYRPSFLNVAGLELVSRVRIADEIVRRTGGRLQYKIVHPGEEFYTRRAAITQMKSLYLYENGIIDRISFTEMFAETLKGAVV